ncbi:MAG: WxcM-like domain-containing protein [Candidatus Pacebacteria bacterium]|nr:WxcM-like domain-containing protein [Candidatus Paceibacterota bacterium]
MKLPDTIPSVKDVQIMNVRGPWDTKSQGKLMAVYAMPYAVVQSRYLDYDSEELHKISSDVRGLRIYTVRDLPAGKIGGIEWHRIREEIVFVLDGSFQWECEDFQGGKRQFTLDSRSGLWIPPFILHTYKARESGSGLFVLANTLFVPEDSTTHDTYSAEEFCELRNKRVS